MKALQASTTSREGKSMPEMRESAVPLATISAAVSRLSAGRKLISGKAVMACLAMGLVVISGKAISIWILYHI